MLTVTTPGLYRQPVARLRATGRLSRGDIPVFLGYAQRGPVGMPVRVTSLSAAIEIFGPPLAAGHLQQALKGFFENGGLVAYVIRVAPDGARVAEAVAYHPKSKKTENGGTEDGGTEGGETKENDKGQGAWIAQASFAWRQVDPRERKREARPDEANWVQLIEEVFRTQGPRSPAPGTWANDYELRIRRSSRARTQGRAEGQTDALYLDSMAGLELHSVLELRQVHGGRTREASATLDALDPVRQRVVLSEPLAKLKQRSNDPDTLDTPANFDLNLPLHVRSVEFDVEIFAAGQLEQAFSALAPDPRHSASLVGTMATACRSLSLSAPSLPANTDWDNPDYWPEEGRFALHGGMDALDRISAEDWLAALQQVKPLDEVALIAMPDLVLQPQSAAADEALQPPPAVDCHDLEPAPPGKLRAKIKHIDADGKEVALSDVEVEVLGMRSRARTDNKGMFSVEGVPPGLVTVRLRHAGFEPLEAVLQAESYFPGGEKEVTLFMSRQRLPRALAQDDILRVLQAATDAQRVGRYKVVIADPPAPGTTVNELRAWRARLGDSDRIGLVAPWLYLAAEGDAGLAGLQPCPPSGHVCGAFAGAELSDGIHRTGANLALRNVEGLMLSVDTATQGILNPAGINVIRSFAGRGIRLYGTRTLSSEPPWRYLTTRRVVDAIAKTLERGLHWIVFEPNNLMTRHAAARSAEALLNRLWRDGVLAGSAPHEAYLVKCDLENNPDESRAVGQLVVDIGVAPTGPLEFIMFRLGKTYEALGVTEERR